MFKKICITDRILAGKAPSKRTLEQQLAKLFENREVCPDMVILREKDLDAEAYRHLAETVLAQCREAGVKCILNGYPDLASALSADGVQLPFSVYRRLSADCFSPELLIGVSVHSIEEAVAAAERGANYLLFGHIFVSQCKPGLAPRGLDTLREVCAAVKRISGIPVYAIGGINEGNMEQCIKAGAAGVCMMSGYMQL